jgi:glycosyltransferase involved in cell wall biosynthesis
MRGGERVLEALCARYPDAVIVTHVADRSRLSEKLLRHEIRETFIARLPFARRLYQRYLPLMPLALELMDMTEFDLVISSEAGPAKGIIVRPDALHICYCHSPMRYIWDQYHVYRQRAGLFARLMMPFLAHGLRKWDVTSAARVDHFVANSQFVAQRISKYYRRKASILHPPVSVEEFTPLHVEEVGSHYLIAGELVSYKRPDLAVAAFTANGRRLRVVGEGPERAALERMAGPNIEFLGRLPYEKLRQEFARCRALVFPGIEDFGIIPVEVMAAGRPVIALGRGGALDSVIAGQTGLFFAEQSAEALTRAVEQFEAEMLPDLDPAAIRTHAERFSSAAFARRWEEIVATAKDAE